MGVTAAQLAQMQADTATLFDQSALIQRPVPTASATGHTSNAMDTLATVSCSLSTPTGQEMQTYASEIGDKAAWTVSMPVGTNVLENDQLTVDGQVMRVQALHTPESYQACMLMLAIEVK